MSHLNRKFPWGRVIQDHEIGPYTIREFHPRERSGCTVLKSIDTSKTEFHGFIDGKDVNRSWGTLDEALAGLIAYRPEGPNGRAGEYFMAMLEPRAR